MSAAMKRVILIVLDSVGCGDAPDATLYGDANANTLRNIARVVGGLALPNLGQMGLGNLTEIVGTPAVALASGAYGRLTEVSAGKDTTTGHWELTGVVLDQPFPTYPSGFPRAVIDPFEAKIGRKTLGNRPASGTEILTELGAEHILSGKPIIYTSADSVFQIAAHEEIIDIEELYWMCQCARDLLVDDHAVGRVIARPFLGEPGKFTRTERRKDFSRLPTTDTVLDVLKTAGQQVMAVGKIEDIFAQRGLTLSEHTGNNMAGIDATLNFMKTQDTGLIFTNLVDFDSLYGHRNDAKGYAAALQAFDQRLPELTQQLRADDVLIITADHGNDPTTPGTDHSRERVPILVNGHQVRPNYNLGTRDSFADVAATVAELLGATWQGPGQSFANNGLLV